MAANSCCPAPRMGLLLSAGQQLALLKRQLKENPHSWNVEFYKRSAT
nr:MAG TPA_asm: hypothetical protein [Caudoviricetes sp.]